MENTYILDKYTMNWKEGRIYFITSGWTEFPVRLWIQ